jgi:hypothetical protein
MSSGGLAAQRMDGPLRVRASHVEWLSERLSERDWAIIEMINRLRLMRGEQLERLFFCDLHGHSRTVTRGQVLRRLTAWHVLQMLPRRIGGAPRGSSGSTFSLGSGGQRVLAQRLAATEAAPRVRHANLPTERTVRHTLAVSELCVGLIERARSSDVTLAVFEAEPRCWWPDGLGGYMKPDGYVVLEASGVREHTWVEADLATESLPTIKRKLLTYLDFVRRGQLGPRDVMPHVLIAVPGGQRAAAVRTIAAHLPKPAASLFDVTTLGHAPDYLMRVLRE